MKGLLTTSPLYTHLHASCVKLYVWMKASSHFSDIFLDTDREGSYNCSRIRYVCKVCVHVATKVSACGCARKKQVPTGMCWRVGLGSRPGRARAVWGGLARTKGFVCDAVALKFQVVFLFFTIFCYFSSRSIKTIIFKERPTFLFFAIICYFLLFLCCCFCCARASILLWSAPVCTRLPWPAPAGSQDLRANRQ